MSLWSLSQRNGLFLLISATLGMNLGQASLSSRAQESNLNEISNLEEITSLAAGGRFYLDKDSFQPTGNGQLQYTLIGISSNPSQPLDPEKPERGNVNQRVSLNQIDCATGQLKSPIESWEEDNQGHRFNRLPGPQSPIKVTPSTKLHTLLKDACKQYAPQTSGSW